MYYTHGTIYHNYCPPTIITTQIQNHLSSHKTQIEPLTISTIGSTAGRFRDFDRFLVVYFFCCRVNQSLLYYRIYTRTFPISCLFSCCRVQQCRPLISSLQQNFPTTLAVLLLLVNQSLPRLSNLQQEGSAILSIFLLFCEAIGPKKLLECGVCTPVPILCLVCTMNSKLMSISICNTKT